METEHWNLKGICCPVYTQSKVMFRQIHAGIQLEVIFCNISDSLTQNMYYLRIDRSYKNFHNEVIYVWKVIKYSYKTK